ncbi:hypothetical protein ABEX37_20755 [Brevibacillus agri]
MRSRMVFRICAVGMPVVPSLCTISSCVTTKPSERYSLMFASISILTRQVNAAFPFWAAHASSQRMIERPIPLPCREGSTESRKK